MSDEMELETLNPVKARPRDGGVQYLFRFDNGYGASVICNPMSYGYEEGLYELAVVKWGNSGLWRPVFDTPIADDVIGWLTPENVAEKLREIEQLPHPDEFLRSLVIKGELADDKE